MTDHKMRELEAENKRLTARMKVLVDAIEFPDKTHCTGEGHIMSLEAALADGPHHHTVAQCVSDGCDCKCRTKLNTEIQNALKETE